MFIVKIGFYPAYIIYPIDEGITTTVTHGEYVTRHPYVIYPRKSVIEIPFASSNMIYVFFVKSFQFLCILCFCERNA